MALDTAEHSQTAGQWRDGSSLRTGFITGHILSGPDYGNADLRIPVSNLKARGMLIVWAQNGFVGWHICSLVFRPNSNDAETVIVDDAKTTCERE